MKTRGLIKSVGLVSLGLLAFAATHCSSAPSTDSKATGSGGTVGSVGGSAGSTTASGMAGAVASAGSMSAGTAGVGTAGGAVGGGGSGAGTAGSGGTAAGAGGASGSGGAGGAGGAHPVSLNNFDGPVFYITKGDGTLHAIQEGTWKEIGTWSGLPILDAIRGSDADPVQGVFYFTHGAAGPMSNGIADKMGSLGAWDLYQNKLIYDKKLTHGVDQPTYGGGVVYVPAGEYTDSRAWFYYNAADGRLVGQEDGGSHPHDSIYKNGHRYYGGTEDTYLYALDLPGVQKIGPSPSGTAGVRPYTINGPETRAFITWSNYRGFSVADLATGKIIKSISFGGNPCHIAPSHGISISPDNKEVYVMDSCIDSVQVYTATDDPQLVITIPFVHKIHGGTEQNCAWDCTKDGWVMHSRDGKYVYIADSGDIIDTATHTIATYMEYLANCRHGFVEMDWKAGQIVDTTTHVGLGY